MLVSITVTPPGGLPVDITGDCLFPRCTFATEMGAVPGRFDVYVRDFDRSKSFATGSEITLRLGGLAVFGGYITMVGMTSFAPAADTHDLSQYDLRLWHLSGPDYNVALDKRFFRDTADYTRQITIRTDVDGYALRTAIGTYTDMSDFSTSGIVDIASIPDTAIVVIQQGWPVRQQFENFLTFSGAVYYIDGNKTIVWAPYESATLAWGFSDAPDGATTFGFDSVEVTQDASYMANDVIFWGGTALSETGGVVVARMQDTVADAHTDTDSTHPGTYYIQDGAVTPGSSIAVHGKWQYVESHFGESLYGSLDQVKLAAQNTLYGTGTGKGLINPQWQATFRWNSSRTPGVVTAGYIVPISLTTFGISESLPLRSLTITFPDALDDGVSESSRIVQFEGTFGLQLSDSYLLWRYLRRQQAQQATRDAATPTVPIVTPSSPTTVYGAEFRGAPTPLPDGLTTLFTLSFGYVPGTVFVWKSGRMLKTTDFTETDYQTGKITLSVAPTPVEWLYVVCTTLSH